MSTSLSSIYSGVTSPSTLTTSTSTADLKTQFLKLLIAQLKNQDPSNPADTNEMVQEQAQLAELEQMQNLNTNLVSMMAMQNVSQAVSLVGKTITGTTSAGLAVSGTVTSLVFDNGTPYLKVGSDQVPLANIESIS